jgi:Domain of unknown function (DUF5658)
LHFIGYLRDLSTELARETIDRAEYLAFARERRYAHDRRALSWRTFFFGSLTPRRRGNRRGEAVEGLLDWHEPHLLFLAIMILLMSVTDAILTLKLISEGASEANPIMAFLIDRTPQLFIATKMLLTGGGIVVLVALARARVFRVIRISIIIHWCMLGYVALLAYEAWLLRQLV